MPSELVIVDNITELRSSIVLGKVVCIPVLTYLPILLYTFLGRSLEGLGFMIKKGRTTQRMQVGHSIGRLPMALSIHEYRFNELASMKYFCHFIPFIVG
jgi:hypothetical protein